MKHFIIRMVVGLPLLFTLVAILGGINPILAHADAPPIHTRADAPPQRVDCSSAVNPFHIRTDSGHDWVCFTGSGVINVTLYNADVIYTGNNTNDGIIFQNDGQPETFMPFSKANMLYSIYNGGVDGPAPNVNQVLIIILDYSIPTSDSGS